MGSRKEKKKKRQTWLEERRDYIEKKALNRKTDERAGYIVLWPFAPIRV